MNNRIDGLSPEEIMDMASAFQKSRIFLSGYELGIFTILGDKTMTSAEVAAQLSADERGVDRLMNALTALGFLKKTIDKFANKQLTSEFLVKGNTNYMAGIMHTVNLWERWSKLTLAVKQGGTIPPGELNARDPNWLRAFIDAMHMRGKSRAYAAVKPIDLKSVKKVLDVGGGSGAYAMEFCRHKTDISAVVFDLPSITPITRDYIDKEGFTGRVTTVSGDYNTDSLGEGYDLVFLSNILHSNAAEENVSLLKKSYKALNSGGQVVIQDFIMDEERVSPVHGAIFALNMLVGTESGDSYTEGEIRKWLERASFVNIVRKDTSSGAGLMIGYKV